MVRVLFVVPWGTYAGRQWQRLCLTHKVESAGLSALIEADSAGTGPWHVGNPPHGGVLRGCLSSTGFRSTTLVGRSFRSDLYEFDYVLAMDKDNLAGIARLAREPRPGWPSARIRARPWLISEVPDPYMNGRFEETYRLAWTTRRLACWQKSASSTLFKSI